MKCPHTGDSHEYVRAAVVKKMLYLHLASTKYEVMLECELCGAVYTTHLTIPHDQWVLEEEPSEDHTV